MDFDKLLRERSANRRSRGMIPWEATEANSLVAGVLLARADVAPDARMPLVGMETRIDDAWANRDLGCLREAIAAWFTAAGLEQQAYVVPVLNELEQAWIDGRLELTPAVAPEEPKEDVTEPTQTELFTAPEPVKADPGKKLWESLFGKKAS